MLVMLPPKRLRVRLSAGSVELVAVALDEQAALIEAINLLSMQTGLKVGWSLRVEADEAPKH